MQNCLQFDIITVTLDKRVKPQGVNKEEHNLKMPMQSGCFAPTNRFLNELNEISKKFASCL